MWILSLFKMFIPLLATRRRDKPKCSANATSMKRREDDVFQWRYRRSDVKIFKHNRRSQRVNIWPPPPLKKTFFSSKHPPPCFFLSHNPPFFFTHIPPPPLFFATHTPPPSVIFWRHIPPPPPLYFFPFPATPPPPYFFLFTPPSHPHPHTFCLQGPLRLSFYVPKENVGRPPPLDFLSSYTPPLPPPLVMRPSWSCQIFLSCDLDCDLWPTFLKTFTLAITFVL